MGSKTITLEILGDELTGYIYPLILKDGQYGNLKDFPEVEEDARQLLEDSRFSLSQLQLDMRVLKLKCSGDTVSVEFE
jgi:hypothetical protein